MSKVQDFIQGADNLIFSCTSLAEVKRFKIQTKAYIDSIVEVQLEELKNNPANGRPKKENKEDIELCYHCGDLSATTVFTDRATGQEYKMCKVCAVKHEYQQSCYEATGKSPSIESITMSELKQSCLY